MILLLPVLLPIAGGLIVGLGAFRARLPRSVFVEAVTLATSALLAWLIVNGQGMMLQALRLTENLTIVFRVDGLTRVFSGLIAFLWPLATLYAFEYMEHESRESTFFAYYLMSYGVTAGIALSGNLFTLYAFYELLTLVTLPLVLHKMDAVSNRAGRMYLYYSISGAALAFIGMIFILTYATNPSTMFIYGGVINSALVGGNKDLLLVVFLMSFVGFGVKAAIFPVHHWLPTVSVAPTPVTALLHAVAVVKAGAFAIIRLIYYSFGTSFLRGTWAQYAAMGLAMFTIVYGSAMAVKEQHFKRRLAYSTVSNLSYIIFGATLMTPTGLSGALTHMLFHGVMKITLFFCAGAVLVQTEREYVQDLRGFGRVMPFTFGVFTVASMALVGVPPLAGFISKWNLATAAAASGQAAAYIGVGALIISAVLTAVYLFTVVVTALFMPLNASCADLAGQNRDPGWRMKLPLIVLAAAVVGLGFSSVPLVRFLFATASGLY
ncbi:MAG: proton-conducting membrane transporter [Clostridia bacterium]|nr:proton-conducting membrane transporter [Clostridia bacterium]